MEENDIDPLNLKSSICVVIFENQAHIARFKIVDKFLQFSYVMWNWAYVKPL